MRTTSFKVWLRPGHLPLWGKVRILHQKYASADQYEITVKGDGVDLEQLVRQQPEMFVMFERTPGEISRAVIS